MNKIYLGLAGVAMGMSSYPVSAAVTIYTSQAAFDAAAGSTTTFGFNEGNSALHYHVANNPYVKSGITFANLSTAADAANGGIPIIFLIGNATTPAYGTDFLSFQNTDVGIVADITSAGTSALGFNYASYIVGGAATISVNGGIPYAFTVSGTPSFIGFTSDTPITSLNVSSPGGYSFDLTSVTLGGLGTVPEPATWAMMIIGFGIAGAAMRRQKVRTLSLSYA